MANSSIEEEFERLRVRVEGLTMSKRQKLISFRANGIDSARRREGKGTTSNASGEGKVTASDVGREEEKSRIRTRKFEI